MNSQTTDAEIIELEHAFWRAIQSRDVEAAARLNDDTCVVTGAQGAASLDRASFEKLMKNDCWTLHRCSFIGEPIVRRVGQDLALIAYKVREELTVDDKPVILEAADSSVWHKRDGSWRCVLHTESVLGDAYGRDRVKLPLAPSAEASRSARA